MLVGQRHDLLLHHLSNGGCSPVVGQTEQHREPGGAFHQGAGLGLASSPDDEVAFPVSGHGTIVDLDWTFGDHHFVDDRAAPFSVSGRDRARLTPFTFPAQVLDEFFVEPGTALHEQGLIDRFVHDTHAVIVGELERQTTTDLLG